MVDQVLGVELERKIVWVEAQIWVAWGEICASRAPNDFSRPSETPNTPTHFPDEPKLSPRPTKIKGPMEFRASDLVLSASRYETCPDVFYRDTHYELRVTDIFFKST